MPTHPMSHPVHPPPPLHDALPIYTAFRFARGQADRGHHVEVFTAPADGEAPDPGRALVHRIDPVLAIGNAPLDRKSTRLNSSHTVRSYAVFGLKKKKQYSGQQYSW